MTKFNPNTQRGAASAINIDLGPLTELQGRWVGEANMGWNVISVPSVDGFAFEVIPYREELTFTPVVVALNRGPIDANKQQEDQFITGLMYEQLIYSTCKTEYCKSRGFGELIDGKPNVIHAETGFFLYVHNFHEDFPIARLATVPHGNSVLALGTFETKVPPTNDFFDKVSVLPTRVDGRQLPLDYHDKITRQPQFPNVFDQLNPNSFLRSTLGNSKIQRMTTLKMSTKNESGGILNIPFIQHNINTTFMDAIFWIETLETDDGRQKLQLQYSQSINLVFPSGGTTTQINWPHVTISTLQKVDDTIAVETAFRAYE